MEKNDGTEKRKAQKLVYLFGEAGKERENWQKLLLKGGLEHVLRLLSYLVAIGQRIRAGDVLSGYS